MASAKDTFESNTFASNTFASGTYRGVGGVEATGVLFTVDEQDSYNAGAVIHGSFSAGEEASDS